MNIRKTIMSFPGDESGVSAIEFAFVTPAFLMMVGLVLVAGEGYAIQRKVNMAARTLVDLAARQTDYKTGAMTFKANNILAAAYLMMRPYDSTGLTMVLSELYVTDPTGARVRDSTATYGATAFTLYQYYALPNLYSKGLNFNVNTFMLVGTVTYKFQPFGVSNFIPPIALTRTVYMSARAFDTTRAHPD